MKILNRKEAKEVLEKIEKYWGCELKDWLDKYYVVLTEKNNIHLVNRKVEQVELQALRINTLGLYIGEIKKDSARLSIEGSQLVAKKATRNILEVSEDQAKKWLRGEDIKIPGNSGWLIIKYNKDILGCGNLKNGILLNYVPKARRVRVANN